MTAVRKQEIESIWSQRYGYIVLHFWYKLFTHGQ